MRRILGVLVVWAVLSACTAGVASTTGATDGAAHTPGPDKLGPIELTGFDFSIPAFPGAQIVGVDADSVQRPNSLREIGLQIISSFDRQGNLQQGFAYASSGWQTGRIHGTTSDYHRKAPLLDTEWSVAAVKGASDSDPSARLGIGLSYPWMDHSLPFRTQPEVDAFFLKLSQSSVPEELKERLAGTGITITGSTLGEILDAVDAMRIAVGPSSPDGGPAPSYTPGQIAALNAIAEALDERAAQLANEEIAKGWNANARSIALAWAWMTPTGNAEDFRSDSWGLWLRAAVKQGSKSQWLLAAAFRDGETVQDPEEEGEFLRRDVTLFGVRYVHGQADSGLALEASYAAEKPEEGSTEGTWAYLLGYERRIRPDQWIQVSVGRESGRSSGNNVLFGLNYSIGMGRKPQITRGGG